MSRYYYFPYTFGVGITTPCVISLVCTSDLNGNDIVETGDLLILLSQFGVYCE